MARATDPNMWGQPTTSGLIEFDGSDFEDSSGFPQGARVIRQKYKNPTADTYISVGSCKSVSFGSLGNIQEYPLSGTEYTNGTVIKPGGTAILLIEEGDVSHNNMFQWEWQLIASGDSLSLSASPQEMDWQGGSAVLTWTSTGYKSVVITCDHEVSIANSTALSGTSTVTLPQNLSKDGTAVTYSFTATGTKEDNSTKSAFATVTVKSPSLGGRSPSLKLLGPSGTVSGK